MCHNSFFIEQMEENTKYNLLYPYHLREDKVQGNLKYDKKYADSLHCHYFDDVSGKNRTDHHGGSIYDKREK